MDYSGSQDTDAGSILPDQVVVEAFDLRASEPLVAVSNTSYV
jgi:hypothetical protein